MFKNEAQVVIDVTGTTTGERFAGTFKCKKILTHDEQLARDQLRRDLLGDKSESAFPRAAQQAQFLSELSLRIIEAPSWWEASRQGRDLFDDEPLVKLYEETMAIETEFRKSILDKAKDAKKDLEKLAPKE